MGVVQRKTLYGDELDDLGQFSLATPAFPWQPRLGSAGVPEHAPRTPAFSLRFAVAWGIISTLSESGQGIA